MASDAELAKAMETFERLSDDPVCPLAIPYLTIGFSRGWAKEGTNAERATQFTRHLALTLLRDEGNYDAASPSGQENRMAAVLRALPTYHANALNEELQRQSDWVEKMAQSVDARYRESILAYYGFQTPRNIGLARALARMPVSATASPESFRKIGILLRLVYEDARFKSAGQSLIRAVASEDAIAARLYAEDRYASGKYRDALLWSIVAILRGASIDSALLKDLRTQFSSNAYKEIVSTALGLTHGAGHD